MLNIPRFIRDLAMLKGIPEPHLSAIVHRFLAAKKACDQMGKLEPEDFPRTSLSPDLVALERELEREDRKLAKRIVDEATEDFRQGLLERRC